ncbi:MAG: glycosyltransferase family 4 protein [Novosphingobium sp.]
MTELHGRELNGMEHQVFTYSPQSNAGQLAAPGHVGKIIPFFDPPSRVAVDGATRVAVIGTYTPRKCGIATFTADLTEQLDVWHPEVSTQVFALDHADSPLTYENVGAVIDCDSPEAYRQVARQINEGGYQAVWLQHEFGIFGGPDGEMVCDFVDRLAAPLIVTFHTVLAEPSANQERIVRHLLARGSRVMVMSRHGRDLLAARYGADLKLIDVIPHGAPDRPFGREEQFKRALGLEGRNVIMTFGLLGPGKGLEQMIEALPAILARHPGTVYRIVGATHPNLVARDGEAYREGLAALASRLGVSENVMWDNRFLDTEELLDQLESCDIYVTPYLGMQQATSGTLSYAVALGKAVVSTPYVHARELLDGGVGILVEPNSVSSIASAVNALLDDGEHLNATKRRAYRAGRETIWPRFAAASAELVGRSVAAPAADVPLTATPGMSGVFAMCDGTGMMQHSIGVIPDRRHGYCLDDNARALILMNVSESVSAVERLQWSSTFASFIQYAWNPDRGAFRNFMNYDRTWCEETGSEDSYGRALWALGHTAAKAPDGDMRDWAQHWFDITSGPFAAIDSPRALSFAMLGAASVVSAQGFHNEAFATLERGGTLLSHLLASARRPDWTWFEAVLAYDNPRMPQALIEAGMTLGRSDWTAIGLETLEWINTRQTAEQGHFRPVGSEGFGQPYEQMPFDQQPLEAQAAVEAAVSAFKASSDRRWIDRAVTAYRWYFGANDRGVVLANIATGRCRDGVTPRGANANCGAESILGFQLAHAAVTGLLRSAKPVKTDVTSGSTNGITVATTAERQRQSLANT